MGPLIRSSAHIDKSESIIHVTPSRRGLYRFHRVIFLTLLGGFRFHPAPEEMTATLVSGEMRSAIPPIAREFAMATRANLYLANFDWRLEHASRGRFSFGQSCATFRNLDIAWRWQSRSLCAVRPCHCGLSAKPRALLARQQSTRLRRVLSLVLRFPHADHAHSFHDSAERRFITGAHDRLFLQAFDLNRHVEHLPFR